MTKINPQKRGVYLTDDQKISWLRLIRSDNIGPATFRDMINYFGSAEQALEMIPELSQRGDINKKIRIYSKESAEKELEIADAFGAQFVALSEPNYPPALRYIDCPPPLLAIKGNIKAVSGKPSVGIVGTRHPSISGIKFTEKIAREIGSAGYTIVSGLALGIDSAAHRATLKTGTITVMAGGLDCLYPPENRSLLEEIWHEGIAISEMPFGWEPRAYDFPRRNRLIVGIGLGLIVVEAAKRSGSLITSRIAGECGRLVFSVPGSPLDPRCEGTNQLIKEGATLVTSSQDVLQMLHSQIEKNFFSSPPNTNHIRDFNVTSYPEYNQNERIKIAQSLNNVPTHIDDIIQHTGIEAPVVYLVLLELDLAGRLCHHPGGMVSLTMKIPSP
ncbi:DNA transporter [Candidatus Liberibacter solanacearum]|uniref:Rossmann fold nucleotide-binding protein Smf n=1 Tax=Candidatus Liberibacter solanacearum TaxID=556287 RepID=A0A0F4VJE2_9HYPH|nr:DNA-processing protein DprA [Candidatus Liberibacter solanacearum]KJZ81509.1 DNA transporter [Candidatus Liberibacter solanacearum]KJZ82409.1 Rossmann fold nucleotide-binding protein Smf [Candidatus Liberibacter solanacearum]KQC49218.1 DNA transporter [Candidatus Liberibacter solanacearum]